MWAIQQVGNYGEIYEKLAGEINLPREGTRNALYLNDGLIYAPPMR